MFLLVDKGLSFCIFNHYDTHFNRNIWIDLVIFTKACNILRLYSVYAPKWIFWLFENRNEILIFSSKRFERLTFSGIAKKGVKRFFPQQNNHLYTES